MERINYHARYSVRVGFRSPSEVTWEFTQDGESRERINTEAFNYANGPLKKIVENKTAREAGARKGTSPASLPVVAKLERLAILETVFPRHETVTSPSR